MTIQQIKDHIAELERWLNANPTDPHHDHAAKNKRAYEHKLLLLDPPPIEHKLPAWHGIKVNAPETVK